MVYVNSRGKLEYMPGLMGRLMKKLKFTMNGKTKIYIKEGIKITNLPKDANGYEVELSDQKRVKDITFYGDDLIRGNVFFRHFILKPDIFIGVSRYNKNIKKKL